LRVIDRARINWRMHESQAAGIAWVRNISSTGMLIETDSSYIPLAGSMFNFDTAVAASDYIPSLGRLIWQKPKAFARDRYLWGIQFVDVGQEAMARLRQRVQEGILKMAKSRQTEIFSKFGLLGLSAALSIYLVVLFTSVHQKMVAANNSWKSTSASQSNLHHLSMIRISNLQTELATTQALYDQSQEMLQTVSFELGATKTVLADTERMLSDARLEIQTVKAQMAQLQEKYQNEIVTLEAKNVELTDELTALKTKIDY
jgi:hypothetical protein